MISWNGRLRQSRCACLPRIVHRKWREIFRVSVALGRVGSQPLRAGATAPGASPTRRALCRNRRCHRCFVAHGKTRGARHARLFFDDVAPCARRRQTADASTGALDPESMRVAVIGRAVPVRDAARRGPSRGGAPGTAHGGGGALTLRCRTAQRKRGTVWVPPGACSPGSDQAVEFHRLSGLVRVG